MKSFSAQLSAPPTLSAMLFGIPSFWAGVGRATRIRFAKTMRAADFMADLLFTGIFYLHLGIAQARHSEFTTTIGTSEDPGISTVDRNKRMHRTSITACEILCSCEGLALEESTPEVLLGQDRLHSTERPCADAVPWRVQFGRTVRGDRLSQACRQLSHRF